VQLSSRILSQARLGFRGSSPYNGRAATPLAGGPHAIDLRKGPELDHPSLNPDLGKPSQQDLVRAAQGVKLTLT